MASDDEVYAALDAAADVIAPRVAAHGHAWWWVGYRGHISPTRGGVTRWGRWRTWADAYALDPGEAPDPPEVA